MTTIETRSTGNSPPGGSKADIAYERIRESILEGDYAPGARLVLDRIARELNVSTLPVREAIRRLEAEGYVEFQQNVGATVAVVDAESYVQAIETLAVIEGAATAQAAPHLTAGQLARIGELNDEMREAFDRLDGRGYADAHDALHEIILTGCQNDHLVKVIADIRARLRRVRMSVVGLGTGGGYREIADHAKLVGLIEERASAEVIEDFAKAHIECAAAALRASSGPDSFEEGLAPDVA